MARSKTLYWQVECLAIICVGRSWRCRRLRQTCPMPFAFERTHEQADTRAEESALLARHLLLGWRGVERPFALAMDIPFGASSACCTPRDTILFPMRCVLDGIQRNRVLVWRETLASMHGVLELCRCNRFVAEWCSRRINIGLVSVAGHAAGNKNEEQGDAALFNWWDSFFEANPDVDATPECARQARIAGSATQGQEQRE